MKFAKSLLFALLTEISADPISNPCPSDCWELKDNICVLKSITDPSEVCFALNCQYDRITIDFSSKLFDVEDDDQSNPFGTPGPCVPFWDSDDNKWQWTAGLGDCGMEVASAPFEQNNYVTFDVAFAVAGERATVDLTELNLSPVGAGSVQVEFQCRYRADFSTSSRPFDVHMAVAEQKAIGDGDFKNGFSINLFQDSSWSTLVDENTKVYIGSTLFVQAEWTVNTLKSKIHFYIESCTVNQGEYDIAIIKENCYAAAVEASLYSTQHVVHNRARFTYKTFSIGQKMSTKETLVCTVRLCVLGDSNACQLNAVDSECPNETSGFGYSIRGFPKL